MERTLDFVVQRPRTVAEAAAALAREPKARVVAGGTDLVPNLRRGIERPPVVVDLTAIEGFDALVVGDEGLALGAGVTLARIANDPRIAAGYPVLAAAAAAIAGPAHRIVGTVGGNLCLDTRCVFYNQSEWWRRANAFCLKRGGDTCHVAPQGKRCHAAFSGDMAPALLALDASVELVAAGGTRRIPLADLYREDGAAHLALAPGEIVSRILVPAASSHFASGYRKARARGSLDFPLAGVACAIAVESGSIRELRIALTGTNSRPFLLAGTADLVGRPVDDETLGLLGKLVQKQTSPMRTTVTQSNYRRQAAAVLAQRLVRELAGRGGAPRIATGAAPINAAAELLARGAASRAAFVCGAERITYAELRDRVARAGADWRRRGVAHGDRVAVKLPDGIPWVIGFLGAMWAGGVAVGVNPRIPEAEWATILADGDFRCILAQSRDEVPAPFRDRVVPLADWLAESAAALPIAAEPMDANAPALWTHSSGTSGKPKAVIHAHHFVRAIEQVGAELFGITPEDRLFASSKLFFAYPQANSLYTGLKRGATVILDAQWPNAAGVAATVERERPTVLFSVPSLYRALLKEGHAPAVASCGVRLCVSAGEALSMGLRDEWKRQTGLTILDGYGASEVLILVLVNRGEDAWSTPSPGVEVEAVRTDEAVPTRIRIRSPVLATGYWKRPDAEAETFAGGAFCPADLFERNDKGQWRFAGREDSLVKIHGRWVDLVDLEERIGLATAGIAEAAAVAVPDADGLDAVAFFYVASPDAAPDLVARLDALTQGLPPFQRPRWLHAVPVLPRGPTGKLLRRQLKELHRSLA
jgi:4-hydroxybenzoyl-CoA reductase beta subunit